ncbi:viral A-type inclusion protein, partial [Reticulomyxa filosa]
KRAGTDKAQAKRGKKETNPGNTFVFCVEIKRNESVQRVNVLDKLQQKTNECNDLLQQLNEAKKLQHDVNSLSEQLTDAKEKIRKVVSFLQASLFNCVWFLQLFLFLFFPQLRCFHNTNDAWNTHVNHCTITKQQTHKRDNGRGNNSNVNIYYIHSIWLVTTNKTTTMQQLERKIEEANSEKEKIIQQLDTENKQLGKMLAKLFDSLQLTLCLLSFLHLCICNSYPFSNTNKEQDEKLGEKNKRLEEKDKKIKSLETLIQQMENAKNTQQKERQEFITLHFLQFYYIPNFFLVHINQPSLKQAETEKINDYIKQIRTLEGEVKKNEDEISTLNEAIRQSTIAKDQSEKRERSLEFFFLLRSNCTQFLCSLKKKKTNRELKEEILKLKTTKPKSKVICLYYFFTVTHFFAKNIYNYACIVCNAQKGSRRVSFAKGL